MSSQEVASIVYQELLQVTGGAAVLLAALSIFLSKIWAERIARREGEVRDRRIAELKAQFDAQALDVKAKLDVAVQRTVHVSKLQFEHEYEIYRAAWNSLFELQQVTLNLRPVFQFVDPNQTKADLMEARSSAFRDPFNAFLRVLETNKPFFPTSVYQAMKAVQAKCKGELIDAVYLDRPQGEYHKEALANQNEILRLIEAACDAIRARVLKVQTQ